MKALKISNSEAMVMALQDEIRRSENLVTTIDSTGFGWWLKA